MPVYLSDGEVKREKAILPHIELQGKPGFPGSRFCGGRLYDGLEKIARGMLLAHRSEHSREYLTEKGEANRGMTRFS